MILWQVTTALWKILNEKVLLPLQNNYSFICHQLLLSTTSNLIKVERRIFVSEVRGNVDLAACTTRGEDFVIRRVLPNDWQDARPRNLDFRDGFAFERILAEEIRLAPG